MENLYDVQRKRGKGIDENKEKRETHKEIERQRRKEMAYLYASLRTQLPLEYIKGKRSICDHMHEAVNYIKHLERNIKELEIKRERIKKVTHISTLSREDECSSNNMESCVRVNSCNDNSVEILLNSGFIKDGFKLSRVLEVVLGEGLDILSCTGTTTGDMVLHMIKTEVCDTSAFDLTVLQDKLRQIFHHN